MCNFLIDTCGTETDSILVFPGLANQQAREM